LKNISFIFAVPVIVGGCILGELATVLFVDDEPSVLSGLTRSLHGYPYRILTAQSGQEGLEVISREAVDVIVSDHMMPQMEGLEFLSRALDARPEIVRILLTGNADLEMALKAINDGHVFLFLRKPCPIEELLNALDQAVRRKKLLDKSQEMVTVLDIQASFLEQLEKVEPGLLDVLKDSSGAVVIQPDSTDIRKLIQEAEDEIDRALGRAKK
jgi:DNA-binding NtrC family response regulator